MSKLEEVDEVVIDEAVDTAVESGDESVADPGLELSAEDDSVSRYFSAEQVEEMATSLLLDSVVSTFANLERQTDERLTAMSEDMVGMVETITRLQTELAQYADFTADAELAVHRVQGFADVTELAAPQLKYASVIKELGLSGHISLSAGATQVTQTDVPTPPAAKLAKPASLRVGEGKTRQDRVLANSTRMHSLLS